MSKRITELELVLPSLFLMNLSSNGSISTSELNKKLREILKPSGEDLEILAKRSDDKFSQKVRNLKAHNTFERLGYAVYSKIPNRRSGVFTITEEGKNYLRENEDILSYLLINDFEWEDLKRGLKEVEKNKDKKRKIEVFDENITIREGFKKIRKATIYERSSSLRKRAIDFYSENGKISCKCCSFNFADFYGKELGEGFIEIHHTKPIFQYEDDDLEKTIDEALKNVIPVCSNCHRMIHRNWSKPLEIQDLINKIMENGVFENLKTKE